MPPCKEEGRCQARQQYLTYIYLTRTSSSNYICTSDGTRKGTKRKKNCSARCITCGARLACFICRQTPKTTETLHYLLRVWPACPARPLACLYVRTVDTMDVYVSRGEAQCITPLRRLLGAGEAWYCTAFILLGTYFDYFDCYC